ncbi:MAG: hypothetical protein CR974_01995 [Gammaproteobacteria bacterium]|nr:MAG: hypothetical protein CR974_01995 [Gammaproteobacteria bacterium]
MTQFTQALRRQFNAEPHRAVATINATRSNGYLATTTAGDKLILTAPQGNYAVGDSVFYDIKSRQILGKSPATNWTDIYV